jgi:hypothetical protein
MERLIIPLLSLKDREHFGLGYSQSFQRIAREQLSKGLNRGAMIINSSMLRQCDALTCMNRCCSDFVTI